MILVCFEQKEGKHENLRDKDTSRMQKKQFFENFDCQVSTNAHISLLSGLNMVQYNPVRVRRMHFSCERFVCCHSSGTRFIQVTSVHRDNTFEDTYIVKI